MNDTIRLSLIKEAFAIVDNVTADGNASANARQRIRDVLAGHFVHVVSAETYAIRLDERNAAIARIADLEVTVRAAEDLLAAAKKMRDFGSQRSEAALKAMRLSESALAEAIAWVPKKNLDDEHHHYDHRAVAFVTRCFDAVAAIGACGHVVNHPNGDGTAADYVSDPASPATSVMVKGGAP